MNGVVVLVLAGLTLIMNNKHRRGEYGRRGARHRG